MARFITRVELYDAKWPDDYDKLHIAMGNEGFAKTILGGDGVTYELPTGEYYKIGEYTLVQVLESAKIAASTLGKKCCVISSEAPSSSWAGLFPLRQ